ncbi:hypothetical protein AQI95_05060 [Streptomyces yokosukanensis]|uniref:Uncharacterized protein n=1 Tax=Streptomyces yokosukanensis TaxID=67386 RepID=A0A101PCY2_9ACTN|nr:hypothetical protein [Streptomyces yokosukanensis]KUN09218.1 hypothetical protein AQI95_05060 [Streptomyces yokosukanensis]
MVMPQDIVFHLPFAPDVSPDTDGARQRSLDRCRRQGLVTHPVDQERFLRWDIAGLMAAWVPRASGDQLDLAVDAVVVATFLDDQFDGPLATRPRRVAAACATFIDVISSGGVAPTGAGPLVGAFAQVWRRLAHQASPAWLERTGRHWRWYLTAYAEEARNRAHRRTPTRAEYFSLRRKTGFVYAMLDLSQKAYGFEVPPHLDADATVRRMLDITADVVDTLNDVHSVEKEESRGDLHNLVLVIEHEVGCDRSTSITEIQRLIHSWCEEFVALEGTLRDGRPRQDTAVLAPLAECMRSAMSGYLLWSRTCLRYARLVPPGEPALVTDLLTGGRP